MKVEREKMVVFSVDRECERNKINKINKEQVENFFDSLYLFCLAIYLLRWMLNNTMFSVGFPRYIDWELRVMGLIVACARILPNIKMWKKKELFLAVNISIFTFLTFCHTRYGFLLEIPIFVLGAWKIYYKKVLRVFIWCSTCTILVSIYGSFCGIVKDLVYCKAEEQGIIDNALRNIYGAFNLTIPDLGYIVKHSFGFVSSTDMAAAVFFLFITIWIYKEDIPDWLFGVMAFVLGYFSYRYTGGRNSCILFNIAAICGVFFFFCQKLSQKKKVETTNKIVCYGLIIVGLLLGVTVAVCVIGYNETDCLWIKINGLMNNRIAYAKDAYCTYGISFVGNYFEMMGAGGSDGYSLGKYNFVDISYCMILVRYGISVFWVWICLYGYIGVKSVKHKKYRILCAWGLIILDGMIEHHALELSYSSVLLVTMCNFEERTVVDVNVNNKKLRLGRFKDLILSGFLGIALLLLFGKWRALQLACQDEIQTLFIVFWCTFGVCIFAYIYEENKRIKLLSIMILICGIGLMLGLRIKTGESNLSAEEKNMILQLENLDSQGKIRLVCDYEGLYKEPDLVGIKRSIWYGNSNAEEQNLVLITKASNDYYVLNNLGFMYAQISNEYGIYTNSKDAIADLENQGIEFEEICSFLQKIDLKQENNTWIGEYDLNVGVRARPVQTLVDIQYDDYSNSDEDELFIISLIEKNKQETMVQTLVKKDMLNENGYFHWNAVRYTEHDETRQVVITNLADGNITIRNAFFRKGIGD